MTQIKNSKVLITGASGGLGQAIAKKLASLGAKVILTSRRSEILQNLADSLGGEFIPADLSDPTAAKKLFEKINDIDILVLNAGLPATGKFEDMDIQEIEKIMRVNLYSPLELSKLFLPGMLKRGSGHIVFVSSLSGKAATPGSSIYSATKFGMRGLAFGMRADLNDNNIGVSVVSPGFIRDAGMFADAKIELPKGVTTRTPEDVADAVVKVTEKNLAELDVAPVTMWMGAKIALVAPEFSRKITKIMGAESTAQKLAEGQKDKK
jgi:short-subunit dehydrogenase